MDNLSTKCGKVVGKFRQHSTCRIFSFFFVHFYQSSDIRPLYNKMSGKTELSLRSFRTYRRCSYDLFFQLTAFFQRRRTGNLSIQQIVLNRRHTVCPVGRRGQNLTKLFRSHISGSIDTFHACYTVFLRFDIPLLIQFQFSFHQF